MLAGALLTQLAPTLSDASLTVALRTDALDDAIQNLGSNLHVHRIDLASNPLEVTKLVQQHDIVIDGANSRDATLAKAILEGAAAYKRSHDKNMIVLHLSGAGNFSDESRMGAFIENSDPFDDTNPEHVKRINASMMPNGASDEILLQAASKGKVNVYIVCPGGIYGLSADHIARKATSAEGKRYAEALGVWSQWMFDTTVGHGFSPYVGPGTSVIGLVHVDDTVDMVMRVFQEAKTRGQDYQPEDAFKHFYLAVTEFPAAKDLATLFGATAFRLGLIPTAEPKSVTWDVDAGAAGAAYRYLAGNIIVKAGNAARLGWRPRGPSLEQSLKEIQRAA